METAPVIESAASGGLARYALYYTPPPGSALAVFGNGVLGDACPPGWPAPTRRALAAVTAEPRIYGFHATLKAPMRLAAGATEADVLDACAALALHRQPFSVGRLTLACLDDCLALVPEAPPPALGLFAAECVAAVDPLRALPTSAERDRRRPDELDPRGRALLDRWGYPYVFEAFRFHMTLTGRLAAGQRDVWFARLAEVCPETCLVIDAVTVLRQDGVDPFRILRRIPFTA